MRLASAYYLAFLLLVLPAGCQFYHLERNAPGHHEVEEPPEAIEREALFLPDDPGEHYLVLSGGLSVGGGWRFLDAWTKKGLGHLGFEVSIEYGQRELSHYADWKLPFPKNYWAQWAVGLNFGWNLFEFRSSTLGPGYLEFMGRWSAFSLGAGWSWLHERYQRGPQFTLSAGPLFVRVAHVLDHGTDLYFGFTIKLPMTFVWSQ